MKFVTILTLLFSAISFADVQKEGLALLLIKSLYSDPWHATYHGRIPKTGKPCELRLFYHDNNRREAYRSASATILTDVIAGEFQVFTINDFQKVVEVTQNGNTFKILKYWKISNSAIYVKETLEVIKKSSGKPAAVRITKSYMGLGAWGRPDDVTCQF